MARRADRAQSGTAVNSASTDDFSYNPRSDGARQREDGALKAWPQACFTRVPAGLLKQQVTGSSNSIETAAQWNPSYSFDKIGNRQSSTGFQPVSAYSTNAVNQYTALDAAVPTHDFVLIFKLSLCISPELPS